MEDDSNAEVEVEYRHVFEDYDGQPMWEFDGATFVTPTDMCNVVQSILMEFVPSSKHRTLIFVQSADVCEYIRDTIHLYSTLSAVTVHGQKSHQEMDETLAKEFDVLIATNILESGDRPIPHIRMVIDFGLCYSMNTYGFVSMRYSSRMEMNKRSKHLYHVGHDDVSPSKKRLMRIMTEGFFHTLPYMELATFDWKHFVMERMLNDQISRFLEIMHEHTDSSLVQPSLRVYETPIQKDMYRDILDLASYHLIEHDFTWTKPASLYLPVFRTLLRTPFHTKGYAVIAHFYHMTSIDSIPLIIQILVSLTMALVDTVHRYGQYKLFYLPLQYNRSPNQMFGVWMRILYRMAGMEESDGHMFMFHDRQFLIVFIELMLTIIMSEDPYHTIREYHINTRVFRQLMYRWKILCGRDLLNLFGYSFPITDRAFLQYLKLALQPFIERRSWEVHVRDHFEHLLHRLSSPNPSSRNHRSPKLSKRRSHRPQATTIQGQWCALPSTIMDAYTDRMWRLLDYSTWTQSIRPYDRRLYFDHEMDDPYVTIDAEHGLYLPMPKHVENHVGHLRRSIENAVAVYQARVEQRLLCRLKFDDCVEQIREEVAYRPNMVRYLECEQRFYEYASAI